MAFIVMQAPGPGIEFASLPSGSTYTSDPNGVIVITNGNVNDQLALLTAGCVTLVPGGGAQNLQTGANYTLQLSDCGQEIIGSHSGGITINLPAFMPVGFFVNVTGTGGGGGIVTAAPQAGASTVGANQVSAGRYLQLKCVVISNPTGTNAVWDTIQVGA